MNIGDLGLDQFDMATEAGRAKALAAIAEAEKQVAMTNAAIAMLEKAIQARINAMAAGTA